MKKIFVAAVFFVFLAANVAAANVNWKGVTWSDYEGAGLNVNSGDDLEVTSENDYGAAHYNTPGDFRESETPCVEVSFYDNGIEGPRAQLWIEDETYNADYGMNTGLLGAWTQFGTWNNDQQYKIYWWDYDTANAGWIDVGERTVGEHTLKIAMRSDGTVDYWLDNNLVHSATEITPNYFGDVYLTARYGTSRFTDYSTCTNYMPPEQEEDVPEFGFAGFLLAAACILGFAVLKRN